MLIWLKKWTIIKHSHNFSLLCIKDQQRDYKVCGDIEVEKHKFHHCKNLILLEDVDIKVSEYKISVM